MFFMIPLLSQDRAGQIERNYQKYRTIVESNPDSALIYILRAKDINKEEKNLNWDSRIYYGIGYCYYLKQEYDTAQGYLYQAVQFSEKVGNSNILSKSYNQIGQVYSVQNDFRKALENYHNSLKISEEKEELSDNTIAVLSNIADLYILQEDTISARRYYHQAKQIGEQSGESLNLAVVYNNLAVSYMKTNKDSTEYFLNKALEIHRETHNYYGQIMAQINLVATYLNFQSTHDYTKAFQYLNESMNLSKFIQNPEAEFFSYFYMGNYYEQVEKNYPKALESYNFAYDLLKKGYKNAYAIELYENLAKVHAKLGNHKEAFSFQKEQYTLQDSIFSIEKNKQFHDAQTRFDVERKNNQIQLLNKQKEIQQGHKRLIAIGAVSVIIPLMLLAFFYRQRMKYQQTITKQDKLIFEKEKEAIKAKNLIEGQKMERNRIARELHDGVGGRLSAIKIKIDQINTTNLQDPELEECIKQLQETTREIRVISHELNENKIDQLNFVHLIKKLVKDYKFYFTGEIHLNMYPENKFEQIEGTAKHFIYRTLQEILSNCLKYAEAENIAIDCTFDTHYRIIVEDDGKGFDVQATQNGMGINNIYKRVESLNGQVYIDAMPGRGATFIIEIPEDGTKNI